MAYQLTTAKVWDGTQWVDAVGGGASYDPVPVTADLHAHFDATQLDLVDGDAVAQWDDVSGNARHATQATAAARPTFRKSSGGTWVSFDGVDDYLATASWTDLSQPNDIFFVGAASNYSGSSIFLDGLDASHEHSVVLYASGPSWRLDGGTLLSGGTPSPSPHVFHAHFDGASSTLRVDGVQVIAGNAGTESINGLILGGYHGLNGLWLNGLLGEVLLYSATLSTTDRDAVEAYLAAKWGTP